MLIIVYTKFLPMTASQVLRLENADMLLSSLGTSTILIRKSIMRSLYEFV